MRVEQDVKIFESKNSIQIIDSVYIGEYFLIESEYKFYLCQQKDFGRIPCVAKISIEKLAIKIAKLLNEDNGGQDNTFPMFDNWKPDIEVSESVLKEFIFFWTGKLDIKKTNEQWLQALAQSQQYADSRNEYYRNKGDNHG